MQQSSDLLKGIVEADETFVLPSFRGQAKKRQEAKRSPRKRGGKAQKRDLSKEQVPILYATDRSGASLSRTLVEVSAASIVRVLKQSVRADARPAGVGCQSLLCPGRTGTETFP